MAEESMKELKEMISGETVLSPYVLIHLAPYLSEHLLSRAISIACAVQDPFERSCILQALASSKKLSETKKKELLNAALDAAQKIISKPEKAHALVKLMPLISDKIRHSIEAQLDEEQCLINLKGSEENTGENVIDADVDVGCKYTGLQSKYIEENTLAKKITSISDDERDDLVREVLVRLQTRVVNTGFALSSKVDMDINPTIPLDIGQLYYFWLEIGQPTLHSIEDKPVPLPDDLPSDAQLKVAIFPFRDEIQITAGADVGELQLQSDGIAHVLCQPASISNIISDTDILNRRLLFPVKTPEREGTFRLRCSIYHKQILIQSRLISAVVSTHDKSTARALNSTVDYALSYTLWPDHLKNLDSHRLSILLNNNGDETHTLSFMGAQGESFFKHSASIPATELMIPIDNARKALQKVSWGDEDPWEKGKNYRYKDGKCDLQRLKEDLTKLAVRGYILYNAIIDKFTDSRNMSYDLAQLMLKPGMVQIAVKNSPTQILPAALFYDYPLDTQASPLDSYKLCDTFISSLQSDAPLEKSPCFNEGCPHSKLDKPDGYICPSGFWGYRHSLGLPVSLSNGMDVPPEIALNRDLQIVVGVAINLDRLNEHMKKLQNIRPNINWHCSANRKGIIDQLKNLKSHLVYFYCHGGFTNNTPYLQVGKGSDYIDGSNLRSYHIVWDNPQPLVFINGCHTTALDPGKTINLVQDFINTGGAGVIGTEITIFEPLACNFAESCLQYFFAGGNTIGNSVRMARLKLLKEGNPLGLVYTPFVLPSLRIKE